MGMVMEVGGMVLKHKYINNEHFFDAVMYTGLCVALVGALA